jgi:anthranilate phosphoribosyltransferase
MTQISRNISEVFYRLNVGAEVKTEALARAFADILSHTNAKTRDVLLGAFLTSTMVKGPRVKDVVTLLKTAFMLDGYSPAAAAAIKVQGGKSLVGAVGSGKKGVKTMNVSTPSAIIAASAGVYVAKSGSSATSSLTGSADLMREMGVAIDIPPEEMIMVLQQTGFCFFSIENTIPKFDKTYGGRFHAPHILSFGLPALVSPVKFDILLFGLAHPDIELSIRVLKEFGIENATVVSCTNDEIHFLDEMGIFGTTKLVAMQNGRIGRTRYFLPTEELGLPIYTPKDIAQGKTKEANVAYVVNVLRGAGAIAHEDIICVNAANILYLGGQAENLRDGYYQAKKAVMNGTALDKLVEVIEMTRGDKKLLDRFL